MGALISSDENIIEFISTKPIIKNMFELNQSHIYACGGQPIEIRFLSMKDSLEYSLTMFIEYSKENIENITIEIVIDDKKYTEEIDIELKMNILSSFEIDEIISRHPLVDKEYYMEDISNFILKYEIIIRRKILECIGFPGKDIDYEKDPTYIAYDKDLEDLNDVKIFTLKYRDEIFDKYGNVLTETKIESIKEIVYDYGYIMYKEDNRNKRTDNETFKEKKILGKHNIIFDEDDKFFYKQFKTVPRNIDALKKIIPNGNRLDNFSLLTTEKKVKDYFEKNQKMIDQLNKLKKPFISSYKFGTKIGRTTQDDILDSSFEISLLNDMTKERFRFSRINKKEIYDMENQDVTKETLDLLLHSNLLENIKVFDVDD